MVARLSLLQLFLAFAVATARNDPPPSSDRAWSPPSLPNYERDLPHIIPRQRKAAHGRGEPASANGTRLTAEWQTGVETMSGCRAAQAPFVLRTFATSKRGRSDRHSRERQMARRHVPARHLNASGDDTQRSYSAFGHSLCDVDILHVKIV